MINSISQSENDYNSFNSDIINIYNDQNKKEKNNGSYIIPYLSINSEFKNIQDNYDYLLEKDFEEISGIFPYNIKGIKNFKEDKKIKENVGKKLENN